METPAEVIQRALAVALLANRAVNFQPDQFALRIVVEAAPPTLPVGAQHAQSLDGDRGVFERTPRASSTMIEHGRGSSQGLSILLRRPKPRAGCEHVAQILGEAFVNPQEVANHRLLVVARHQASGPAILAVPRVHELVGKKRCIEQMLVGIEQRALAGTIVAGFMVLQAMMAHLIAQGIEEVILAVMMGTKKR